MHNGPQQPATHSVTLWSPATAPPQGRVVFLVGWPKRLSTVAASLRLATPVAEVVMCGEAHDPVVRAAREWCSAHGAVLTLFVARWPAFRVKPCRAQDYAARRVAFAYVLGRRAAGLGAVVCALPGPHLFDAPLLAAKHRIPVVRVA